MNELNLFFKKGDDIMENEYKEVWHLGCKCFVDRHGDVYTENGKGVMTHRNHRYNNDGYAVVSACSHELKKSYSLQVHILVALAFVENPDKINYTEVNHLDFNRRNPCADNLSWCSHKDNISYSVNAVRYTGKFGKENPNYGNSVLSDKYKEDKQLSKEKQSRPRSINGRAKKCILQSAYQMIKINFNCQRDAVDWLINMEYVPNFNKEYLIRQLKTISGYCGWKLIQI